MGFLMLPAGAAYPKNGKMKIKRMCRKNFDIIFEYMELFCILSILMRLIYTQPRRRKKDHQIEDQNKIPVLYQINDR